MSLYFRADLTFFLSNFALTSDTIAGLYALFDKGYDCLQKCQKVLPIEFIDRPRNSVCIHKFDCDFKMFLTPLCLLCKSGL